MLNLTGLEDLLGFANKSTNEYPHRRWKCTAFQAGFRLGFMPQNEFCGYENPAFQAKKIFNSPAHFCLKGNKYATCGQRHPYNYCLKGRTTAVAQMNIHTDEKRTNENS
jgi:hypothetical protein